MRWNFLCEVWGGGNLLQKKFQIDLRSAILVLYRFPRNGGKTPTKMTLFYSHMFLYMLLYIHCFTYVLFYLLRTFLSVRP